MVKKQEKIEFRSFFDVDYRVYCRGEDRRRRASRRDFHELVYSTGIGADLPEKWSWREILYEKGRGEPELGQETQ